MSWVARLRLLGGLVAVVVLVAVLTAHLNDTQGRVGSVSAQVLAERVDVGSAYAGVVRDAVVPGQRVAAGETLFVVESAALRHDVRIGLVEEGAGVGADGTLEVAAAVDGTVTDVTVGEGAFVQAGAVLATLERDGSRFVEAELDLTAEQLARLEVGAAVTVGLADGSTVPGVVERVAVETSDATAHATLTVSSGELATAPGADLTATGTPVTAEVVLRNDGVVTRATAAVREWAGDLLDRVGT